MKLTHYRNLHILCLRCTASHLQLVVGQEMDLCLAFIAECHYKPVSGIRYSIQQTAHATISNYLLVCVNQPTSFGPFRQSLVRTVRMLIAERERGRYRCLLYTLLFSYFTNHR